MKDRELHIRIDGDLLVAVNSMANEHHEGNASQATREALRERAVRLGYLPGRGESTKEE